MHGGSRWQSFAKAPYALTSEIADEERWLLAHMDNRQARLAELAPTAWLV